MPRVSVDYLSERRRQIVEAAVRCFARKGINATTMQDVFAESGLSPGGVYRYFKSKDALILAIADGVSVQLVAAFPEDPVEAADPAEGSLGEELQRLLGAFDAVEGSSDQRRVAMAIWNQSLYDPAIGLVIREIVARVGKSIADRISALQRSEQVDPDLDPVAAAQVILSILPGYLLQRCWFPDLDPLAFAATAGRLLGAQ